MNNINKITASSILLNQHPKIKENIPAEEEKLPEDIVEKSSNKDFKKQKDKTSLLPLSKRGKKSVRIGTIAGALIGGTASGIITYSKVERKILTSTDIGEVTLTWEEPVMKPELIGKIPTDYYTVNGTTGTSNGIRDVFKNNPLIQDGKVVMQTFTGTWKNFGTPKVICSPQPIHQNTLSGYLENVEPVKTSMQNWSGSGNAGVSELGAKGSVASADSLVGYKHVFTPNILETTVGYYDKPTVIFDNGVNKLGYTTGGCAIGLVAGCVAGALIGAVIEKIRLVVEANSVKQ